jgi:hypothetical protein
MARCTLCGARWSQDASGLCRRCRGKDALARKAAKEAARDAGATVRDEALHPPWRVLVCDHREFWVIWDGSDRYENPAEAGERFRREGVT